MVRTEDFLYTTSSRWCMPMKGPSSPSIRGLGLRLRCFHCVTCLVTVCNWAIDCTTKSTDLGVRMHMGVGMQFVKDLRGTFTWLLCVLHEKLFEHSCEWMGQ